MNIKKVSLILLSALALLSSCGGDSSSDDSELLADLSKNHQYSITIDKDKKYVVDGSSFKDVKEGKTYFKYQFKDNYQVYNESLIDDNYVLNSSIAEETNALIDKINTSFANVKKDGEYYNLGSDYKYSLVNLSFDNVAMKIENKQVVLAYYTEEMEEVDVTFTLNSDNIYLYGVSASDVDSFYENNTKTYQEMVELLKQENFYFLIVKDTCQYCPVNEKNYFEFSKERNINIAVMNITNYSQDEKNTFIPLVKDAYNNQDSKFKDEESLPEGYIKDTLYTPTLCYGGNSQINGVLLGYSSLIGEFVK